jgi:hypothetical protein
MQAHRVRTLVRLPDHSPVRRWLESPRGRTAWNVAKAIGGMLLVTAVAMIVGHIVGALFGVKQPADPRTPGGPTEQDLDAFVALGTILAGFVACGWRPVHGSLVALGGAIAFWAAIPELWEMAVLLGALGSVTLVTWIVERLKAYEHHHNEQAGPPPRRNHDRIMPHHPVRPF